jgi:hypothetical protein
LITKRQKVLASSTHLVEIDLLRQGKPMPMEGAVESNYRLLVSRSETRPKAALYGFNLRANIPQFPLPLGSEDIEHWMDLQGVLHEIYDQGAYALRLDYSRSTLPALSEADAAWIDEVLRQQGLK